MFFDLLHTSSSLPVLASTFTHLGILRRIQSKPFPYCRISHPRSKASSGRPEETRHAAPSLQSSTRSSPPSSSSSTTERNPSQNSGASTMNSTSLRWDRQAIQFFVNTWVFAVVVLVLFPIITSSLSNMALYMGNQGHGIATKFTSKMF
ncbi:unnamed protein product [Lactuca virosa]|uniref:Uncharacterized protein n=1 Tax=Lactuca virosa TaxID=75947 RepID=A0AAU9LVR3_9ASTR|nr:unnamed protein product [Lactuca virosa]